MDVKVSLPDELGKRAKDAKLPLSRMLRDAIGAEFARRDAVEKSLKEGGVQTYELQVEVDLDPWALPDGVTSPVMATGRITGAVIAEIYGWVTVYLTDDKRVIVHFGDETKQHAVLGEAYDSFAGIDELYELSSDVERTSSEELHDALRELMLFEDWLADVEANEEPDAKGTNRQLAIGQYVKACAALGLRPVIDL